MDKIDLTQTFVNHDELRGWGIKGLRNHRGDFTGYKNKRFIIYINPYFNSNSIFCFFY